MDSLNIEYNKVINSVNDSNIYLHPNNQLNKNQSQPSSDPIADKIISLLYDFSFQKEQLKYQQSMFHLINTQLNSHQESINSLRTEKNELNVTVNNQQVTINDLQLQINHQQRTINDQQITINDQLLTINHLDLQVNRHQTTINNQQVTINDLNLQVDQMQEKINHHEVKINHQGLKINDQKELINDLLITNSNFSKSQKSLIDRISLLENNNNHLELTNKNLSFDNVKLKNQTYDNDLPNLENSLY